MPVDLLHTAGEFVERCPECSYCIFEEILSESYRRNSTLDLHIPNNENHMHRELIEDLCDQNRDEVCNMKYVAMRAAMNERQASQFGVVRLFIQDTKEQGSGINYEEGLRRWIEERDFGRGVKESYAKRFDEIWRLGTRMSADGKKQILKTKTIFGYVTSEGSDYDIHVLSLTKLKQKYERSTTSECAMV